MFITREIGAVSTEGFLLSMNTPKRSKSPWFAFYPEDYMGGTRLMTLAGRGAFVDLLNHQFLHGSIPTDDRSICRLLGAFPDEWDPIKDEVMAKFPGGKNPRMTKEIQERQEIRQRKIDAGKKGAAKRWKGDSTTNGTANGTANGTTNGTANGTAKLLPSLLPMASTSTSTSTFSPSEKLTAKAVERQIEEIYQHYPKKVGKPQALKAIKKSLSKMDPETLLEKTKSFALARKNEDPQFTPNPSTWFNQERYNDDPETWKPSRDPYQKPQAQRCL